MKEAINLNFVQDIFIKLAERQGIPLEELKSGWNKEREDMEWNIDYSEPLQVQIDHDIELMLKKFMLHRQAMEAGDLVTASAALDGAGTFAGTLSDTFSKIYDECYKVLGDDKRFTWPEIPDDYKIPEHYDYTEPTGRIKPEGPPPKSVLAVGRKTIE
jgi:hypothetical protein